MKSCNLTLLKYLLSLIFFCSPIVIIELNAQAKDIEYSTVTIPGSQIHKINSAVVDQEYVLHIQLPMNYEKSTEKFPVVYLIDSQWDFPLINGIYGEQYYDGFLPGLIIVGITWGGENPNYDNLRARDLTPTVVPQGRATGNASKFLEFIKTELIPYVDSNFKTAKDERVLMGSSFGGLFTLFALFSEPSLFNRYVLTSPALGWDNSFIYSHEKKYSEKSSKLPAKVYAAIGEYEQVVTFSHFFNEIKSHNYEGLELQTKVIENTGHSGNKAEGYSRGLQFVFARPVLKLSDDILNQYIGSYQTNMGPTIKVLSANGQLTVEAFGSKTNLLAESETDFYVKGFFVHVHFEKNENGKVTGAQLKQFSGELSLKKLD